MEEKCLEAERKGCKFDPCLANQGRFSFCSRVKNAKQGLACQGTRIRDTRLQVNRPGRGVAMPLKCGVQEEFELSLPTLAERLEVK